MGFKEHIAYQLGEVDAIAAMTEKLYQALGRRTIVKHADMGASGWVSESKVQTVGGSATYTRNADHGALARVNNTWAIHYMFTNRKYDLTNASVLELDVEVLSATSNVHSFGLIDNFPGDTTTAPVFTQSAYLNTGARSLKTLDISAAVGYKRIGVYLNLNASNTGTIKVYGVKIDGVSIPFLGDVSGADLALNTNVLTAKALSPLITGSYQWDTLQGTMDEKTGSIVLNVLNENWGLIKADVQNLEDISDLTVDKIYLEAVITRPVTTDASPLLKDIWVAYLA